jgi:hypothetical protein
MQVAKAVPAFQAIPHRSNTRTLRNTGEECGTP